MTDKPNPTPESVAIWLKNGLTRETLHNTEWKQVNSRFNGITRAARPYILNNFPPEEQEAAFDGLTLALAAIAHFEDIAELEKTLQRFMLPTPISQEALPQKD
ncbi:MAG: hypothetical protein ABWX94_00040 [Candidatus Saccharimonadales bacterium]